MKIAYQAPTIRTLKASELLESLGPVAAGSSSMPPRADSTTTITIDPFNRP